MYKNIQTLRDNRFFGTMLVVGVFVLLFAYFVNSRGGDDSPGDSRVAKAQFPEVTITAEAAYVYDVRTGEVLFAKNENTRLSLASLTKVMTAFVAHELAETTSSVVVGREALLAEGDSGLYRGERWRLKDLLDFSLITSSNDGMQAVAVALAGFQEATAQDTQGGEGGESFVVKMNNKAAELGLNNTYYFNPTGLDESDLKGGGYGSARDMATLLAHILAYNPEVLEVTRQSQASFVSQSDIEHSARNTNSIIEQIPGLKASKTGYTNIGGGNLAVAFDPELGRPIIVVVLGSTLEGRFEDVLALTNATMAYITGGIITN